MSVSNCLCLMPSKVLTLVFDKVESSVVDNLDKGINYFSLSFMMKIIVIKFGWMSLLIAVDDMRFQIADVLKPLQLIITRVKICIETLDEYSLEDSEAKVLFEFDFCPRHLNAFRLSHYTCFTYWRILLESFYIFYMFWEMCMHWLDCSFRVYFLHI